jgi:hypothetical protein
MMFARMQAWFKAPRIAAFCVLVLCSGSAVALGTPKWTELTPKRQEALKPLAGEWDKLDDLRKKKWLVVELVPFAGQGLQGFLAFGR